jgi:phage-related protein
MARIAKPLVWIGRSRDDMKRLPRTVQGSFGFDLYRAQCGEHPHGAKPLKGYGGAGVVELVEDHDRSTYRAVYTVRFAEIIYVLHVFQKKSRRGIATPKPEIELIKSRLRRAEEEYDAWRRARSLPR